MNGKYTPTYSGSTTPGDQRYYTTEEGEWEVQSDGRVVISGRIIFHATPQPARYPPKTPAKGSISRRKMTLRRAGVAH